MHAYSSSFLFFFFNDTATTEIYTLSLHDALPISVEVQNIGPDAVLAPEFPAPQTPVFEMVPKARFRNCELSAKFPAARFQSRNIVNKGHARSTLVRNES